MARRDKKSAGPEWTGQFESHLSPLVYSSCSVSEVIVIFFVH